MRTRHAVVWSLPVTFPDGARGRRALSGELGGGPMSAQRAGGFAAMHEGSSSPRFCGAENPRAPPREHV